MKSLRVLVCCLFVSACAAPLPVVDNPSKFADKDLPFDITTFDKLQDNFKRYYLMYLSKAQELRIDSQRANETGFYSSILAVLGGIAKSPNTAMGGALIGAGSGLYSDRYKLTIQATNYETAADAMLCMYLKTQALNLSDSALRNLNGFALKSASNTQVGVSKEVMDSATEGFLFVRDKLYRLQANFVLGTPDASKLKAAIEQSPKTAALAQGSASTQQALATAFGTANQSAIETYQKDMKACEAKISG